MCNRILSVMVTLLWCVLVLYSMSGVHAKGISCMVKHNVFYIACPVCMLKVYSCRITHTKPTLGCWDMSADLMCCSRHTNCCSGNFAHECVIVHYLSWLQCIEFFVGCRRDAWICILDSSATSGPYNLVA
jgi:hypothetical protein